MTTLKLSVFKVTVCKAARLNTQIHSQQVVNDGQNDTRTDILPGYQEVQSAFKDLMIHEICDSHYVSHLAAFFIVAGAKRSIVKGCNS